MICLGPVVLPPSHCVCCRYGKLQYVRFQPSTEPRRSAVVAFADSKSAAKARAADHDVAGVALSCEFAEPGSSPGSFVRVGAAREG